VRPYARMILTVYNHYLRSGSVFSRLYVASVDKEHRPPREERKTMERLNKTFISASLAGILLCVLLPAAAALRRIRAIGLQERPTTCVTGGPVSITLHTQRILRSRLGTPTLIQVIAVIQAATRSRIITMTKTMAMTLAVRITS
jgi:hypothetical protein